MSFYSDISPFYEQLFPLKPTKTEFLAGLLELREAKSVLDLACGPGNLAAALAEKGFEAAGLDNSEELLSRGAAARGRVPGLSLVAGDMQDMPFISGCRFDAVFCLGNSLPHLGGIKPIKDVIKSCFGLLAAGGVLLLQMMDIGFLRSRGEFLLPDLHAGSSGGGRITLRRSYRAGGPEDIIFNPVLERQGQMKKYTICMYGLDYKDLWRAMNEAGFEHEATYRDFLGKPWNGSTASYITVAKKLDA